MKASEIVRQCGWRPVEEVKGLYYHGRLHRFRALRGNKFDDLDLATLRLRGVRATEVLSGMLASPVDYHDDRGELLLYADWLAGKSLAYCPDGMVLGELLGLRPQRFFNE